MEILEVAIDQINVAPYNPRIDLKPGDHRYEVIEQSLDEFGLVEPLVWNKRTKTLVSGHQRLKIIKSKGDKTAPCVVVDLDEAREKALNLTLNNPAVAGGWEADSLLRMLESMESNSPDLYDGLDMMLLKGDAKDAKEATLEQLVSDEADENPGPPEMELLPYEHYDYIVLMFKDSRDFTFAVDHFGLEKVGAPGYVGSPKIGLGRVVDGGKYLEKVRSKAATT